MLALFPTGIASYVVKDGEVCNGCGCSVCVGFMTVIVVDGYIQAVEAKRSDATHITK